MRPMNLLLRLAAALLLLASGPARAAAAADEGVATLASLPGGAPETVVLLHGLARSDASMRRLEQELAAAGYRVCNIAYPSREHPIAVLAGEHVLPAITACAAGAQPLHFVTHSLGGIVVRQLAALQPALPVGRVVMLGPPNGGSEIVDWLVQRQWLLDFNGPAGLELGTADGSVPRALGPTRLEVGVIAGNRSLTLLSLLIPGDDDGKVSVASAQLDGMRDFIVLPVTHTFMMRNDAVIAQAIHFLRHGRFARG